MKTILPVLLFLSFFAPLASAQSIAINNDVQTYATLTNTTVTMTGRAELRITGTGNPIPGCIINLNSPDAWFLMTGIQPSVVNSTFLSRVKVNGAAAVADTNCRVVQYAQGAMVIPHGPSFAPLTIFDGQSFTGHSRALAQYTKYGAAELGGFNDAIRSLKLKRGYTATIAQNPDGSGISKNYVASDGDLEIGALPASLDNSVSFVRVFPWRWISKKGTCDDGPVGLNASWNYNWNINSNSTPDWEYVAIKQQRYWPSLDQDWKSRGVNHLSGYNEPNNPVEDAYTSLDNGSTTTAVAVWPELLSTGLRVGAPAVTDGGYNWIVDFMNKANAAGVRVDYVPVHYYRSYPNNNDAAGAANNLYNFLKSIHDATGKPIWLTEFNNGANWTSDPDPTVDQNKNVIEAMINMMDNTWWIERYSVYSHVEWFRQTHYDDGGITPMGAMYRDHVAPLGYVQEMPSAGKSAAAQYAFDGDLRDALMNGNDAMAVGAPVFTAGKYGQAISLDGTTDYLQVAEPLGDSNDFTFTAWVNWNGGSNWQRIFDFGNGGTDNYVFLTPKSGTNTLRFGIRVNGADQFVETTALPTGVWTHVAVTISDTTAKIFVNGALKATKTGFTFDPGELKTNFNYIGKSQWPDPLFSGKLDDMRFFTSALSDAQIAVIAGGTPPLFSASTLERIGAVCGQPFTGSIAADATSGSGTGTFTKMGGPAWIAVAADGTLTGVPGANDVGMNTFMVRVADAYQGSSTALLRVAVDDAPGLVTRYAFEQNVNATAGTANGTATGSPIYNTGKYGSAIDLDGADDFVTLPKGIVRSDALTIASWVYWDGGNAWQRIFDFGNGTSEYLMLTPKSAGNALNFEILKGGVSQKLNGPVLATSQWVHVAVTIGGGTGKLYVNGALADTQPITIEPTDIDPGTNYLGKSQWPDPLFNGRLDEFLIFNQALTAPQVAALVSGRAPGFTVDPISIPNALAGQIYEQTIAGSATDPDAGAALTYSKMSGPRWLTISPDGRVSGVPSVSDAGTNRFVVRVTDSAMLADDAVLNIVVPPSSGLIALYQFDGNFSDSVSGAAATASGAPAFSSGLFDKALSFDGTNDYVTLPAGTVGTLTDATFAARVRWDGGAAWQRIFDLGSNTSNYLMLTPASGSGVLFFEIKAGGVAQSLSAPAPLRVGEWTHVAVTLIGNTGTLHVNGTAVATGAITHNPSAIPQTLSYLGKSQFNDPLFKGAIDDFRVFNYGLSSTEVAALAVPAAATLVPDSSYNAWTAAYAFPGGQSGMAADTDQDGLSNAWEYLTGTNPTQSASGTSPTAQVRTAAQLGIGNTGKTYLTIQPRVIRHHLGAFLVPEAAATIADLASPQAATHVLQAGAPIPDGAFDIYTFYFDTALEDSPTGTGFIRLRVNLQ